MTNKINLSENKVADNGFNVGYTKRRRHPSATTYLSGSKNKYDLFDTDQTEKLLDEACEFIKEMSKQGKTVLFAGTKPEAKRVIEDQALSLGMPYVNNRWIGGTLTNFPEIKKRIKKLEDLLNKKEKGELAVYTKKEQSLINKEITELSENFSGLVSLTKTPDVIFIVDTKHEQNCLDEAINMGVKTVALLNSDCDMSKIDYKIPGDDGSRESISYVVKKIADSFSKGKMSK